MTSFLIGSLCGFGEKIDGSNRKGPNVPISGNPTVFLRSNLFGHHFLPGLNELLDRKKIGLKNQSASGLDPETVNGMGSYHKFLEVRCLSSIWERRRGLLQEGKNKFRVMSL
jgi:hypothetical protein